MKPQVVGVVNITADSFSDGGRFLESGKAIEHAEALLASGADILDLGAAASNPHARFVSAADEITRLAPIVAHLKKKQARISIDTTKPEVQRWAIREGADYLNDIRGFPEPSLYPELAASDAKLIVMHMVSDTDKAVRQPKAADEVLHSIRTFFSTRLPALEGAGIAHERLIADPGMGFFLASNPEPSLGVLAALPRLGREFNAPLMVGVSRKSFLKNIGEPEGCDIRVRTLAAELFAAERGVAYIRTHDVHALNEGLRVLAAVGAVIESAHRR